MRFEGKVVIVTGSSSGIGRAAAEMFAAEGARLAVHGQDEGRLETTMEMLRKAGVDEGRLLAVRGPVEAEETRRRLIDETVAKFGRLDVLVNNAGCYQKKGVDPNSLENLDFLFRTNLRSVVDLTERALPHLEQTKGAIVNVSSVGAVRVRCENMPYVVLKAALEHYTRNAAIKHAPSNVRINTVSPGATDTNFTHTSGIGEEQKERLFAFYAQHVLPLHRLAEPKEVAAVVLFLASPAASYVSGSTYVVDGGLSVGNPQPPSTL